MSLPRKQHKSLYTALGYLVLLVGALIGLAVLGELAWFAVAWSDARHLRTESIDRWIDLAAATVIVFGLLLRANRKLLHQPLFQLSFIICLAIHLGGFSVLLHFVHEWKSIWTMMLSFLNIWLLLAIHSSLKAVWSRNSNHREPSNIDRR